MIEQNSPNFQLYQWGGVSFNIYDESKRIKKGELNGKYERKGEKKSKKKDIIARFSGCSDSIEGLLNWILNDCFNLFNSLIGKMT